MFPLRAPQVREGKGFIHSSKLYFGMVKAGRHGLTGGTPLFVVPALLLVQRTGSRTCPAVENPQGRKWLIFFLPDQCLCIKQLEKCSCQQRRWWSSECSDQAAEREQLKLLLPPLAITVEQLQACPWSFGSLDQHYHFYQPVPGNFRSNCPKFLIY